MFRLPKPGGRDNSFAREEKLQSLLLYHRMFQSELRNLSFGLRFKLSQIETRAFDCNNRNTLRE